MGFLASHGSMGHTWYRSVTLLVLIVLSCSGELKQYPDEDKDISLQLSSDTAANLSFSATARTVNFSLSFTADRDGSYKILHAGDCSGARTAAGQATQGGHRKGATVQADISLSYDDVLLYGKEVVVCVKDRSAYKSAGVSKNFSSELQSALASAASSYNESSGGGGANIQSGAAAAFPLFQANFTSFAANRGGAAAQDGASNPYSHGVYLDPNDSYKFKYLVVDRGNNRVLIFNSIPSTNSALPDVVVGQSNFANANANAGSPVGAQGFDQPVHVSVSAGGILFVTDYANHRVLGYNTIPKTNGTSANFVLGQNTMTSALANNVAVVLAGRINHPYAAHAIGGRLYLVDQDNHRIVVYNSVPTTTAAAASFVIGQLDFSGVTGNNPDYTIGGNTDYMSTPYDLLVYSNRLYVSDTGHHRILVFSTVPSASNARPTWVIGHTGSTQVLANQGFANPSESSFNFPTSMAAQNNKLAVADQVNNRVLFFDLPITGFNQAAQQVLSRSFTGNCAPANCTSALSGSTQGAFNNVKGLVFDNGYIWVGDGGNNRVQVLALPY